MQLCSAYSHWILDVSLVVTYSIQTSEGKKHALANPHVWEKENQEEMTPGNWVHDMKMTSTEQTYPSSWVI